MHPCPGNWVAIGRAVVYSARAAHAFSAGTKCQHKSFDLQSEWYIDELGLLFICYPWVFVQPGTGRRPVDCCRNKCL